MNSTQTPYSDEPSVSIPALRQYLQMADRSGLDYQTLLKQAQLSATTLADTSQRISLQQFETVVKGLLTLSNDDLFGLHTSEFIETAFYSVQGYIALNCSTFNEVLNIIPMYEKIVGDMGVSHLQVQGSRTLLRWRSQLLDAEVQRQVCENIISSWVRFSQQFLRLEGAPLAIWFEHSAPASDAARQQYAEVFACPVEFSQAYSGVWIDSDNLSLPISQADEGLLQALLEHASTQLQQLQQGQSMTAQVKSLLRLMLNKALPSAELIAEQLSISVRTLQRKLRDEGASYQGVLDELRFEMACYYVLETALNFDLIASKLGFSEPRSFYRSFKKWTGTTASLYREQASSN